MKADTCGVIEPLPSNKNLPTILRQKRQMGFMENNGSDSVCGNMFVYSISEERTQPKNKQGSGQAKAYYRYKVSYHNRATLNMSHKLPSQVQLL